MNNKKQTNCDNAMSEYLMLDKNQHLPFRLTFHLLKCSECRRKIKMLSEAENHIAAPLKIPCPVTDETIKNVMMSVDPAAYEKFKARPVGLSHWIISGIVMIFMLVLSIYSTSEMQSPSLVLIYGLMIAFCVTLYCTVFVMSNVDFFVKKLSTVVKGSQSALA